MLSVDRDPERDTILVFVFPRDFERILILVSSVVRRSKMVLKILENAPCILARRGAELNSITDDFPSIVFIYCFQSSAHSGFVLRTTLVRLRSRGFILV